MASEAARPDVLVTPEWLHARLADPAVRIVDCRPPAQYANGHLPSAANVDFIELTTRDTSPDGLRAWIAQMETVFTAAGVGDAETVVFYEDTSGYVAARGVWALTYLGHDGARLLDGGLGAWRAAGFPLATDAAPPTPGREAAPSAPAGTSAGHSPTAFRARPRSDLVATYDQVLARLSDPGTQLLDVRRPAEWDGTEIRAPRGGRIPGAIHLDWVHNLAADGRFKPLDELAAQYAVLGLDPTREVIPYCQGGYRSANTWLALRLLGYPNVRNYLGSWGEWGSRDGLPIENLTLPEAR
jgi:thiosulfate/3-mercaptopyruvate sulfurtransferase